MDKIYLDTNIYLDHWDNRKDKIRPLGEFAFQILKRVISCEFLIVVSNLVICELNKKLTKNQMGILFSGLKKMDKIINITGSKADIKTAKKIARYKKVPWPDVLHCLLAKKAGAKYVITRDKHFFELSDLLESKFPEDL